MTIHLFQKQELLPDEYRLNNLELINYLKMNQNNNSEENQNQIQKWLPKFKAIVPIHPDTDELIIQTNIDANNTNYLELYSSEAHLNLHLSRQIALGETPKQNTKFKTLSIDEIISKYKALHKKELYRLLIDWQYLDFTITPDLKTFGKLPY